MNDRTGNTNSETTISVSTMMTIDDCCAAAQVSRSFINKQIAAGRLPILKFGRAVRVRSSDWIRFVEALAGRAS